MTVGVQGRTVVFGSRSLCHQIWILVLSTGFLVVSIASIHRFSLIGLRLAVGIRVGQLLSVLGRLIFCDKPLCAGDGDAKGWSTAGFWANMFIPIQPEQLSVTMDDALILVVTVGLDLASGCNRLPMSVQSGSGGKDFGHDKVGGPTMFAMGFTHFVLVHSLTKNGQYLSFDQ